MASHVVPRRTYFGVALVLFVLLGLTLGAAEWELGPLGPAVALGIAVAKATLIVLFFMHVWYSPPLLKIFAVAGFLWLGILLAQTLADYLTRNWLFT